MFDKILTAGRYIFWKGGINQRFEIISLNSGMIAKELMPLLTYAVFNPYVVVLKVESHEKAILYEDGRISAILEPGAYYFWKGQMTYTVSRVDQRAIQLELSGQEILTRDKATIRLTVFTNYRVIDMMKAIIENKDFEKQVYVLIQLVLREFVGNLTLDQILEVREKLTDNITEQVTNQLERLGIELLGLGIRDIILPGDMKEIMNQVLMAEKKAQANVIMRREETASTRSLLNTAKIMEENQMVWKLKEMEYVERIAERVSHIQLSGAGPLTDQLKNLFVNTNNN
jgi:regulator of protease activity HflC (stomatin/prohibitin superfamily)